MANIKNIPKAMITEHVNWHSKPGNVSDGGRAIEPWPTGAISSTPGSGEEFLVWHKGYLERFHKWVKSQPVNKRPKASVIKPWDTIPKGLKMGMVGWNVRRARDEVKLMDMSNFSTLDELGRFLEWGLHGWFHNASARMWQEPVLNSYESPRSTYFWQLHGLIDFWRAQWVENRKQIPIPIANIRNSLPRINLQSFSPLSKRVLQNRNSPRNMSLQLLDRNTLNFREEWTYLFKTVEISLFSIPEEQFSDYVDIPLNQFNVVYNSVFHMQHIDALNERLRDYFAIGFSLVDSTFHGSIM